MSQGERRIVVGSGRQDVDLTVFDDPYVSPQHAAIVEQRMNRTEWVAQVAYFVEDLGSTNGTRIISPLGLTVQVRSRVLIPSGWRVQVGRTVLPWRG